MSSVAGKNLDATTLLQSCGRASEWGKGAEIIVRQDWPVECDRCRMQGYSTHATSETIQMKHYSQGSDKLARHGFTTSVTCLISPAATGSRRTIAIAAG